MKGISHCKCGVVIVGLFFLLVTAFNVSVANAATTNVSAMEAYRLVAQNKENKDFIVLDIRTAGEFSQGHIKNAVNIDFYSPDFQKQLDQLAKDKIYLMHCKSGGRSGKALSVFNQLNFKNVFHMNGGFNEWASSNLPVVR